MAGIYRELSYHCYSNFIIPMAMIRIKSWKYVAENLVWAKKLCKNHHSIYLLFQSLYNIKMTLKVKKSKGSVWFASATGVTNGVWGGGINPEIISQKGRKLCSQRIIRWHFCIMTLITSRMYNQVTWSIPGLAIRIRSN